MSFTLEQIREKFLKYFEKNNFKIMQSSSTVPTNDPTLLFTNAGMVQFKNYFTGVEKAPFMRATTVQKCVRAGGKHNDLDNVGYTARHHTFFEMLGNFSFGDLSKEEALKLAWNFLTVELGLPREKLLATVYYKDNEAYEIWKNVIGLTEDRIIRLDKDNFWAMGDTGPCGPSSEIFYDHGEEIWGGKPGTAEEDGDRYVEIWNVVFMQYERNKEGEMKDLPKRCIDTGIGLERITTVLQGVHNNYDIDLFKKIIDNSKNILGDGNIFCHRIIADHLRSSCFLIADGVLPSNEGKGYVLRRIMRRAMLQIHKLGCKSVIMYRLVPNFVNLMGSAYGELKEHEELIMETLKTEEERFRATLDNGIKILEEKIKNLNGGELDGKTAFELYDTYGFPLDLTQMILREKSIAVNTAEFDEEMKKQKERARASWTGTGDIKHDDIYLKLAEKTIFEGYEKTSTQGAKILNIIKNKAFVDNAVEGEEVDIILDKTSFYGECGGQIGDDGVMIIANKDGSITLPFSIFEVISTSKTQNSVVVHRGKVENGSFKVGDFVNLSINEKRRKKIAANHSAAHLLQYALRELLGNSIAQKGSYVDEFRLRYDVAYNGQIKNEILRKAENIVNEIIFENTETMVETMSLEKAKKCGAIALFNEKYGEVVRVMKIGKGNKQNNTIDVGVKDSYTIEDVSKNLASTNDEEKFLSIELCAGTHVKRTGDIGCFKIIKEESISAGVRRIESMTGMEVISQMNEKNSLINNIGDILKINEAKLLEKVSSMQKENKELSKRFAELEQEKLKSLKFNETKKGNITIFHNSFSGVNAGDFKMAIAQMLNEKYDENTIFIANCINGDKKTVIVAVSKDLKDSYDANGLLKLLNVKGGGQKTLATGSLDGEFSVDSVLEFVK